MRIIAGSARGTKLKAPKGLAVRPTSDRVREALFNIIGSRVIDSVFIDLFAGSGAVGLEALSRGADYCIFVDIKRENIKLIGENLAKTKLQGKARLICSEAYKVLETLTAEKIKADLIYIDPPYSQDKLEQITDRIIALGLVNSSGMIVVEHAARNNSWVKVYSDARQKFYGDTALTFITEPFKAL